MYRTILPLLHYYWKLCQLYSCCVAEVLLLCLNSLSSPRPAMGFSSILFSFPNKYFIFSNFVYSNSYWFPPFQSFLYWLFSPNCLLHFALNENVLLAKLVLFLNCGIVALGHLMNFSPRTPNSHPVYFFFSGNFWAFYVLELSGNSPFEASVIKWHMSHLLFSFLFCPHFLMSF